MGKVTAIRIFEGEWRFLSNFYPAPVRMDGHTYPTVEHAFQAAKTLDDVERRTIQRAPSPGVAKRMGREIVLRLDWEEIKRETMQALLMEKFRHPELMVKLLATGDAELEEGNTWGDNYWGTVNGVGQNWLGRLLMQVRGYLRCCLTRRWIGSLIAQERAKPGTLTLWERDFVRNLPRNVDLSEKQFYRLEQIWADKGKDLPVKMQTVTEEPVTAGKQAR